MRKKVILTVSGSGSDDPQTEAGENILASALSRGAIENLDFGGRWVEELGELGVGHYGLSCHRCPGTLFEFLDAIADLAKDYLDTDFVLIMGAGWAAALPGIAAGYLHRELKAVNVFVIGVAFDDIPKEDAPPPPANVFTLTEKTSAEDIMGALCPRQLRGLAALLSVDVLPGGGRVTCRDERGVFFAARGFEDACLFAIEWEIPEDDDLRKSPEPLPAKRRPKHRDWVTVA